MLLERVENRRVVAFELDLGDLSYIRVPWGWNPSLLGWGAELLPLNYAGFISKLLVLT